MALHNMRIRYLKKILTNKKLFTLVQLKAPINDKIQNNPLNIYTNNLMYKLMYRKFEKELFEIL